VHLAAHAGRTQADGTEIPLLKIAHWDFDWQNRYTFAAPVALPKGATIRAELVYDNSKDNKANPNKPPKRVRWGRETTDEMGSITLMLVPKDEADLEELLTAIGKKNAAKAIARAQEAIDEPVPEPGHEPRRQAAEGRDPAPHADVLRTARHGQGRRAVEGRSEGDRVAARRTRPRLRRVAGRRRQRGWCRWRWRRGQEEGRWRRQAVNRRRARRRLLSPLLVFTACATAAPTDLDGAPANPLQVAPR
jgi:hypothetical protein